MSLAIRPIGDTGFSYGHLGHLEVIVDENGYMNATKLAKKVGKDHNQWKRLEGTKSFKRDVAERLSHSGEQISVEDLTYAVRGGSRPEITGTYLHPYLLTHFACWLSPSFGAAASEWIEEWKADPSNQGRYLRALSEMTIYSNERGEDAIQAELAEVLGARREVVCPCGRIDLLTDRLLIEVKRADDWLKGVGQLMMYGDGYPDHKKVLYIYDGEMAPVAVECCCRQKIKVINTVDDLEALQTGREKRRKIDRLEQMMAEIREENARYREEAEERERKAEERARQAEEERREAERKAEERARQAEEERREAERKAERHARRTHAQLDTVQSDLGDVKEELVDVKGELGHVSRKLGVAKHQRVPPPRDPQSVHRLVVLRLGPKRQTKGAKKKKAQYSHSIHRVQEKSLSASLASKRRDYPRAEVILDLETPNSMNLFNRFKEKYSRRIDWDGIYVRPIGTYDESKLIRDLKKLHEKRMTDASLE